jgi:hypothetical protein
MNREDAKDAKKKGDLTLRVLCGFAVHSFSLRSPRSLR